MFTRLNRSGLLDHKTRRRVQDTVEANPGIRFVELRNQTGLPNGVLTHHLGMLEDHGLVVTVRRGRQRHLYTNKAPRGTTPEDLTQRQAEILALLRGGDLTQSEIAQTLQVSQQTVSYHLRRLKSAGRISRQRGLMGAWAYLAGNPGSHAGSP